MRIRNTDERDDTLPKGIEIIFVSSISLIAIATVITDVYDYPILPINDSATIPLGTGIYVYTPLVLWSLIFLIGVNTLYKSVTSNPTNHKNNEN